MAKRRKHVEYRWFPATSLTGVLGGIVAKSEADAEMWAPEELFAKNEGFRLVRVRMEYEIPALGKSGSDK